VIDVLLKPKGDAPFRLLCLGSHCDDIEIGCGGTVRTLIRNHRDIEVTWVVFGSTKRRAQEARDCAERFLKGAAKHRIIIKTFRDGFFPFEGTAIKEFFESIKKTFSPDLVLTHFRDDRHQDHRLVSDLTWNTFRDHMILEYEVPKYDGDLGSPNFFVHLDEGVCRQKAADILECYVSQKDKHWFTEDTLFSLLRLRGIESCSPTRYAEAFYCRKIVMNR
jgi:LmbE family N-acetylglucosaminyl deacetylase